VPLVRRILDLPPVEGEALPAAALDALIAERLAEVPDGITDQIVRLRVYDVPRHVARELNHSAIRTLKNEALHLQVDVRRPEIARSVGVGSPGRRQTLPEMVRNFLERRPLPAELDREAFVRIGTELMDAVEREAAGL
jgi:hypothetical protein